MIEVVLKVPRLLTIIQL